MSVGRWSAHGVLLNASTVHGMDASCVSGWAASAATHMGPSARLVSEGRCFRPCRGQNRKVQVQQSDPLGDALMGAAVAAGNFHAGGSSQPDFGLQDFQYLARSPGGSWGLLITKGIQGFTPW